MGRWGAWDALGATNGAGWGAAPSVVKCTQVVLGAGSPKGLTGRGGGGLTQRPKWRRPKWSSSALKAPSVNPAYSRIVSGLWLGSTGISDSAPQLTSGSRATWPDAMPIRYSPPISNGVAIPYSVFLHKPKGEADVALVERRNTVGRIPTICTARHECYEEVTA